MPYTELYDLDTCAKFVSEYITYEPLDLQVRSDLEIQPMAIARLLVVCYLWDWARAVVLERHPASSEAEPEALGCQLTSLLCFAIVRRLLSRRTCRPPML